MNVLLARIRSTLAELDLGLKGDLTMSEPMERLMQARSSYPTTTPPHHGMAAQQSSVASGLACCTMRALQARMSSGLAAC